MNEAEAYKQVLQCFAEATDEREFPNWDDAGKPSPVFAGMVRLILESERRGFEQGRDAAAARIAILRGATRDPSVYAATDGWPQDIRKLEWKP